MSDRFEGLEATVKNPDYFWIPVLFVNLLAFFYRTGRFGFSSFVGHFSNRYTAYRIAHGMVPAALGANMLLASNAVLVLSPGLMSRGTAEWLEAAFVLAALVFLGWALKEVFFPGSQRVEYAWIVELERRLELRAKREERGH